MDLTKGPALELFKFNYKIVFPCPCYQINESCEREGATIGVKKVCNI
jgi:hypothetical protein